MNIHTFYVIEIRCNEDEDFCIPILSDRIDDDYILQIIKEHQVKYHEIEVYYVRIEREEDLYYVEHEEAYLPKNCYDRMLREGCVFDIKKGKVDIPKADSLFYHVESEVLLYRI